MISAFGVEHTFSKSFNKLQPKLYRALKSLPEYEKQTDMKTRLKYNALHTRGVAGNHGKYNRTPESAEYAEFNQGWKRMGEASTRGHENLTRRERKGRKRYP